jgi:hypothetical protein
MLPRIDVLKLLFQGDNSDLLNDEIPADFDFEQLAPAGVKLDDSARALLTAEYSILRSAYDSSISGHLTNDEQEIIGSSIASLGVLIRGILSELTIIEPQIRDSLLEKLRHIIVNAYIIGARGIHNPTLERLAKERRRAQTQPARHKKNVVRPGELLRIVTDHTAELWKRHPNWNGNASRTATEIVAAVNRSLDEIERRHILESTIRKILPKVPGWKTES